MTPKTLLLFIGLMSSYALGEICSYDTNYAAEFCRGNQTWSFKQELAGFRRFASYGRSFNDIQAANRARNPGLAAQFPDVPKDYWTTALGAEPGDGCLSAGPGFPTEFPGDLTVNMNTFVAIPANVLNHPDKLVFTMYLMSNGHIIKEKSFNFSDAKTPCFGSGRCFGKGLPREPDLFGFTTHLDGPLENIELQICDLHPLIGRSGLSIDLHSVKFQKEVE